MKEETKKVSAMGGILFYFVDTYLCFFLLLYSTNRHLLSSICFYYLANERSEKDTKMKEETKMREEGGGKISFFFHIPCIETHLYCFCFLLESTLLLFVFVVGMIIFIMDWCSYPFQCE